MELLTGVWDFVTFIRELLTWFTRPSIMPWVGALAAIAAAITIETSTWLKSPLGSVGRALRVAFVFLVIAWMLNSIARIGSTNGNGQGSGEGGGDKSATNTTYGDAVTTTAAASAPGQAPSEIAENVDLIIGFVASPANPSIAQSFACNLVWRLDKRGERTFEIRATNMEAFDKLIERRLREQNLPETSKPITVLIKRVPDPGESVRRHLVRNIRAFLPDSKILQE